MSSLKFFKGKFNSMPETKNRLSHSFYLAEDTNDFYYTNENKKLIRLSADPDTTIKEIHTFYNIIPDAVEPTVYPLPENSNWTKEVPYYHAGEQIYSITCTIYMSGRYSFSEKRELITYEEIDEICSSYLNG